MKKTMTSKKGFTLMEMICVVAIVIFLGTIFTTSVVSYVGNAKEASAKVIAHQENAVNRSDDDVKAYLRGYTRTPAETTVQTTVPVPIPGPATPSAGGGTPDTPEAPAPNPPPQTSTTQESVTTTTVTEAPTTTTAAPSAPGNDEADPGNGGTGNIEAPGGYTTGDQDKGVYKINKSADGKTTTVVIQNNAWNRLELTFKVVNGKLVLTIGNENNWMLSDANIFPGLWNGQKSWEVTSAIKQFLQNNYGLVIG